MKARVYRGMARRSGTRLIVTEKWANYADPVLSTNTGYTLAINANECPQFKTYSELYRRFRIKKVTYMLVPQYNVSQAGVGSGQLPRVTYAIQDTNSSSGAPASEADVLVDNGCKIVAASSRVIYINTYPKPDLATDGVALQTPVFQFNAQPWLNTTNPENNAQCTGENVQYFGVNLWCAGATGIQAYAVFVKATFEFADPA